jgi:hypothetical protein
MISDSKTDTNSDDTLSSPINSLMKKKIADDHNPVYSFDIDIHILVLDTMLTRERDLSEVQLDITFAFIPGKAGAREAYRDCEFAI